MRLASPRLIVLDSATLGKASRDYWSRDKARRDKARGFVARLRDQSIYITFSLTQVLELLRHGDESVVRDRIAFLRILPLVAWLRPYDRNWFPGGIPHLLRRELHAVVHEAKGDWREILEHVRSDIWETGLGSEIFMDDERFWSVLRTKAQHLQRNERHAASVARTDPGNIKDLTLAKVKQLPKRPKAERVAYMQQFAAIMKMQLEQHGDRRLEAPQEIAAAFSNGTLEDVDMFESAGGDPIERLLEYHGVPHDLVTDDMTVGDIGQLAVYIKQLTVFSKGLRPPAVVTVREVPPDTLPSYVLENRLARIQRKAKRVSGSDFGDSHIAPLLLYADAVEVDKRTFEYLTQVQRTCPAIGDLLGNFFRSSDYAEIPDRCGTEV